MQEYKTNNFWIIFLCVLILIFVLMNIKINKVLVDGNVLYSSMQIEQYIFEKPADRISVIAFFKNIFAKKKNIPYVEKYTMRFISPVSVHIQVYENPIIGYIEYNQNYVYFDKNGVVVKNSRTKDASIPRIEGVNVKNVSIGEKLLFENEEVFKTLLQITQNINKHKIEADRIKINSLDNITIFVYNLDVFLGKNENLELKIQTFSDMLPQIKDLDGYLDLSKVRENMPNEKYIFKKRKK